MLGVPRNQWGWAYTNAAVATTPGVAITSGSGAKGSWYTVVSAANCTNDVYFLKLWCLAGASVGSIRDILYDIGVDLAGGTSFVPLISNIAVSQSASAMNGGIWCEFPIFIKAGSSIGVRAQSNTAGTSRANLYIYGRPSKPEVVSVGQYSETLGVSGNAGTAITPGNSAAWSSWVSLGTTSQRLWHWHIMGGFSNATTTSLMYMMELAVGDGTTYDTIIMKRPIFLPGTSELVNQFGFGHVWEVPPGSTLYARASCSGTTVAGFNALAVGIGG